MILGLRTASYQVPADKLSEARDWYARAVGVPAYFDQPFYVGFSVGGFELGLLPDGGPPGPGGCVAYWGTADIGAEVERLVGIGAVIRTPVTDVGSGIKTAELADPYGNTFAVIENPHFDVNAVK